MISKLKRGVSLSFFVLVFFLLMFSMMNLLLKSSAGFFFMSIMNMQVVIAVDELGKINASSNPMDPSQKYIQLIAGDSHEFWFMGFISYNKAVKTLTNTLQQSRA
uniref:Uncharacterized protein n=1 Tax=Cucumis sativus TaxID=3659 RepID=A0A0A0LE55_CUCSA